MRLAYYISGHGYGHAVRSCVIANALGARHELFIVTAVAEGFLRSTLTVPFHLRNAQLDVGVAQPDGLAIDFAATLEALGAHAAKRHALIAAERDWLREERIERVLADVPPVAFAAAHATGIPSCAIANFGWDEIYAPYEEHYPGFAAHSRHAAEDYGKASLLLQLPFATPMPAFKHRQPMGLVARAARHERNEVRRRLRLDNHRYALLSFGGLGMGLDAPTRWQIPNGWRLCAVSGVPGDHRLLENVEVIAESRLSELGLGYPDLLSAVDCVITKPGYGIVSECIACRTPMVYTSRGPFAEYPHLVEGIAQHLPHAFIEPDALRHGRLTPALEAIADTHWPRATLVPMSPEAIRARLGEFVG